MDTLKELNEQGTTIIQVTHNELNAAYARRIIRLNDGWIENAEHKAQGRK
jgi:ABC-type lipoprotein export system ATPase subunit